MSKLLVFEGVEYTLESHRDDKSLDPTTVYSLNLLRRLVVSTYPKVNSRP